MIEGGAVANNDHEPQRDGERKEGRDGASLTIV